MTAVGEGLDGDAGGGLAHGFGDAGEFTVFFADDAEGGNLEVFEIVPVAGLAACTVVAQSSGRGVRAPCR